MLVELLVFVLPFVPGKYRKDLSFLLIQNTSLCIVLSLLESYVFTSCIPHC